MASIRQLIHVILLALSVALWVTVSSGCATAVVAGAGVAAGIVYTDRGAKSEVNGSVASANRRAVAVFQRLGIHTTEVQSKESGAERSLEGKHGDRDITVSLKGTGANTTAVEVIAKKGTLNWDKDYAKNVLSQIVQQG